MCRCKVYLLMNPFRIALFVMVVASAAFAQTAATSRHSSQSKTAPVTITIEDPPKAEPALKADIAPGSVPAKTPSKGKIAPKSKPA